MREALLAMSYREVKSGCWMKPVGFHAFSYNEEKNEWANWFKNGLGKTDLLTTKHFGKDLFESGEYLDQLKRFEACTRIDINPGNNSCFELMVIDL